MERGLPGLLSYTFRRKYRETVRSADACDILGQGGMSEEIAVFFHRQGTSPTQTGHVGVRPARAQTSGLTGRQQRPPASVRCVSSRTLLGGGLLWGLSDSAIQASLPCLLPSKNKDASHLGENWQRQMTHRKSLKCTWKHNEQSEK